ncbi:hypothetical protein DSCO28_61580 [Desulfosarcina ovata subsp. sediminis]|uniref:Alkyl hydroperoxide reductase subunit C/ Thiol specific antioxidant domain-containing protein n=1 Tax=Desulfosarcina ovata subsp. sediminis TaxID=885957 RepID=A0A5K7ZZB8_9BACT|nr:hypothetical protein DSCO28_61580 [Desulfosarcina ovata subsp. sediminis]
MRDEYDKFEAHNAVIIVIGPEKPEAFEAYWRNHRLPFVGLPDPTHTVLKRYGQEVRLFKLGRMPAQVIVDPKGRVRYVHYGYAMTDIPSNEEILGLLDQIEEE